MAVDWRLGCRSVGRYESTSWGLVGGGWICCYGFVVGGGRVCCSRFVVDSVEFVILVVVVDSGFGDGC